MKDPSKSEKELLIQIPEGIHRWLRNSAAEADKSIDEIVIDALDQYVNANKVVLSVRRKSILKKSLRRFTPCQQRLFMLIACKAKPGDNTGGWFHATWDEILAISQNELHTYEDIYHACKSFENKPVTIKRKKTSGICTVDIRNGHSVGFQFYLDTYNALLELAELEE